MRRLAVCLGLELCLALALVLLCSPSVRAQETPKVEVFGGYSYLNFDVTHLTGGIVNDRLSANGWEASASFAVNDWFALEGDFSGHYKGNCEGITGLTCKDLSFMGGPRLTYRKNRYTAFAHGLFGGDNGSFGFSGFSLSDTPFAAAAGGGVDYDVTPHIAIRAAQVDYFMTRHAIGSPLAFSLGIRPSTQNNFRVSAGVVFRFGGTYERGARVSGRSTPRASFGEETILLGITGYGREDGVVVTSVRDDSPAARAGIKAGDVIMSIDGEPVRSSGEIETAVGTSKTGTVRVIYFASGVLQSEVDIKIR